MSHHAYVVNWDEYQKTLSATRSYARALEPYESIDPGDFDGDVGYVAESWFRICKSVDLEWAMAFENVLSFYFHGDEPVDKAEAKGFERLDKSWVIREYEPLEVQNLLEAWKELKFKSSFQFVPKKLRHRYIDLGVCAKKWKEIFKDAGENGRGVLVCFYWDH